MPAIASHTNLRAVGLAIIRTACARPAPSDDVKPDKRTLAIIKQRASKHELCVREVQIARHSFEEVDWLLQS